MKQLEPTSVDHFISEHEPGQTVSGRLIEVRGDHAKVEVGEGVIATCELKTQADNTLAQPPSGPADVNSLTAMLAARWKQGGSPGQKNDQARAGQVRSFRIAHLDPAKKLIQLELAS
jgi:small subunit ribosomal protein S1